MRRFSIGFALAALMGFGGGALAQSYSADGGDPAVTEPGGTLGRDGAQNIREGVRDGEAVGVPRGTIIEEREIDRRGSAGVPREPR